MLTLHKSDSVTASPLLMRDAVVATLGVATFALIGTVYVLVHEHRRRKKLERS